jgi:hypothetical protein
MNDEEKFKMLLQTLNEKNKDIILFSLFKNQNQDSKKALIEYATLFLGKKND